LASSEGTEGFLRLPATTDERKYRRREKKIKKRCTARKLKSPFNAILSLCTENSSLPDIVFDIVEATLERGSGGFPVQPSKHTK